MPLPFLVSLDSVMIFRLKKNLMKYRNILWNSLFQNIRIQDDDNDDGLLTNHSESIKEKREYGSISYHVYWKYLKVSTFVKNAQVSVQKILGRRTLPSQHFPFSQCCYSKYEGKVKLEILMKFHKNIVKVLSFNQNYFSFRCTWIFSWANGWKVRAAVLTILETFSNFSVASQSLW